MREDIAPRYLKKITANVSFEGFSVELNLRSKNGFSDANMLTLKQRVTSHLSKLSAALDKPCTDYEDIILIGDFKGTLMQI